MTLQAVLWVALGGAIGATARYAVGETLKTTSGFPVATLGVNLLGSLLMGLLIGWLARQAAPQEGLHDGLRLFLAVGLLGGFTTFSAFSMDVFMLLDKREFFAATAYLGGSLIGGVALFIGGYMLVKAG